MLGKPNLNSINSTPCTLSLEHWAGLRYRVVHFRTDKCTGKIFAQSTNKEYNVFYFKVTVKF